MSTAIDPPITGMRVLVVEDEMAVALSLEDLLNIMGCDVIKAGRLNKALRLAETETVNGALLDVNIAGDSVYPVADELKERGIPFIFMTGYDSKQLPGAYHGHAALPKPFDDDKLEHMMADMFTPVG